MSFFADISLLGAVVCLCVLAVIEWAVRRMPQVDKTKTDWLHPAE
jgi:uncharacterized membrane protein YqhA